MGFLHGWEDFRALPFFFFYSFGPEMPVSFISTNEEVHITLFRASKIVCVVSTSDCMARTELSAETKCDQGAQTIL